MTIHAHILWDLHTARPALGKNSAQRLQKTMESIHRWVLASEREGAAVNINRFLAFAHVVKDLSKEHGEMELFSPQGIASTDNTENKDDNDDKTDICSARLVPVGYKPSKSMLDKTILTEMCIFVADAKKFVKSPNEALLVLVSSNPEFAFAVNRLGNLGYRVVVMAPLQLMPSYLTMSNAVECVDWIAVGLSDPFQNPDIESNMVGVSTRETKIHLERVLRQHLISQLHQQLWDLLVIKEKEDMDLDDIVDALSQVDDFASCTRDHCTIMLHRVAPQLFTLVSIQQDEKQKKKRKRKKFSSPNDQQQLWLMIKVMQRKAIAEAMSHLPVHTSAVIKDIMREMENTVHGDVQTENDMGTWSSQRSPQLADNITVEWESSDRCLVHVDSLKGRILKSLIRYEILDLMGSQQGQSNQTKMDKVTLLCRDFRLKRQSNGFGYVVQQCK